MKRIIAILFLIILANCQKKETELEFEKQVMNEIFIDLVDSIYVDTRTMKIPSKPFLEKGISDSLKIEKLNKHKLLLEERDKRIILIKNDTSRVVLAIVDTIAKITDKPEYKIDILQLKESKKYIFKYYSDFPKGRKLWTTKYPYYFGGTISLSRIKFNENKDFGEFSVGIGYYDQDAQGFDVYIKKDTDDNWIIEKIKGTWIS